MAYLGQVDLAGFQEVVETAWGGDHNLHPILNVPQLWSLGRTSVHTPAKAWVDLHPHPDRALSHLLDTGKSKYTAECLFLGLEPCGRASKIRAPKGFQDQYTLS